MVHFTGHGTADGKLLLENELGEAHLLSQAEIAQLFSERKVHPERVEGPPLVVLSACHSEIIARALNAAGIPALVAIDARVPIADRAATIFAEHFYGALEKGWRIADAFRDAQQTVALDDSVGDAAFTLNPDPSPAFDKGGEAPWSKRFTLIGDGNIAFAVGAFDKTPLPTEPRASGNLRARNANFVGRAKEIVEIVKTFDAAKMPRVAIIGAGGIGKTELSKAVAWWYIERGKVDAVLWASASRDEGEFVLRDLASLLSIAPRAFGLPITEQSSFDEQKRVVRGFLEQHRAIILLDNWETLEGRARKELWDFVLSLPGSTRVIVTSRHTLPPKDARNYELNTLTVADGARLFLNIARNAGYFDRNPKLSKEELAILNAIVERLDGYPLAIEVVAGQTESRALGEIWNDLVKIPKNVLEGKGELTSEPRGVWTSLGFSYDVLPAPAQTLFRQMGVFLAPATVEDIAAIVIAGEAKQSPTSELEIASQKPLAMTQDALAMTQATLDTLVRRSLVCMREGAYALLPIVRDYAENKLTEAGGDPRELHARAAQYYGQKNTIDTALTASEHLFELATRFGERGAAEAFVEYVLGFYYDLKTCGYWTEARRKCEQMIAVARTLGDKVTEAQAIGELGISYQDIGEYARAAEKHRQSQKLYEESGDKRGLAAALHQLGRIAESEGNYAEAERLYRESMELKEELGDEHGIALTLWGLAIIRQNQGNYGDAIAKCRKALQVFDDLGDKKNYAGVSHLLGVLAQQQGNYAEAMRLYRESMKIVEELGDKRGVAVALHELGILAQQQGNYAEAMRLYRKSMKIAEELGDKRGIAGTLHQLGIVEFQQGNHPEAERLSLESMKLKEELGDKRGIAQILHQLGVLAQQQGDYAEAVRLYRESMKIAEELGDKDGIASTLGQLGQLARAQGELKDALGYFLRALVVFEELHSPYRELVGKWIAEVRQEVGEERFEEWVMEITTDKIEMNGQTPS